MIGSNRAPESIVDITIGPPDDSGIHGHIFRLAESPRVRALIIGFDLPEDSPVECWYSVVLDCRFFGEDFRDYTVELIGSQISNESAKSHSPCRTFQYEPLIPASAPLLLWRQRIFHQVKERWIPNATVTLSPTYPQSMFVQSVWHPSLRNKKLVLCRPIDASKSEERLLLKAGKQILDQIESSPLGRPISDEAINHAIRAMAEQQITKTRIAKFTKIAFCRALPPPFIMTRQNIYNYIPERDPKWQQIEAAYYAACTELRVRL